MRLDLGLIGATSIAERVILAPAARYEDVAVRAVAAGDRRRAAGLAARHGIDRVLGDYGELVDDESVNAVYISLHNSAHHRWAVRAAARGKHVIVEKPLCLDENELTEIREAAEAGGVRVVEAVATAGHPWQSAVREMIEQRPYGALRSIRTVFRFHPPAEGSYRTRPELGGGIFFDCASYWLQCLQATAGLTGVTGSGGPMPGNQDTMLRQFHAELHWPDGLTADLACDVGEPHRATVEFVFDTASVLVRGLLRPMAGALPVNLVVRHDSGARQVRSFPPIAYYEAQFDRIRAWFTGTGSGWGGELAAAGPRIGLMAAIDRAARRGRWPA